VNKAGLVEALAHLEKISYELCFHPELPKDWFGEKWKGERYWCRGCSEYLRSQSDADYHKTVVEFVAKAKNEINSERIAGSELGSTGDDELRD